VVNRQISQYVAAQPADSRPPMRFRWGNRVSPQHATTRSTSMAQNARISEYVVTTDMCTPLGKEIDPEAYPGYRRAWASPPNLILAIHPNRQYTY
jgi:hypothetical protein